MKSFTERLTQDIENLRYVRPVFIGATIYVATQYMTIIILGHIFGIAGLALSLIIVRTTQIVYLLVASKLRQRQIIKNV